MSADASESSASSSSTSSSQTEQPSHLLDLNLHSQSPDQTIQPTIPPTAEEECHLSSPSNTEHQISVQTSTEMHSNYNRVSVQDLLNEGPSRRSSRDEILCNMNKCGRKFISEESLLAHQRRSHAPPTAYVCPHCRSSFSTIPNLNKHVRSVHEKLKPFKCAQCPSTFAFKDGLQRHMLMVHDQVRPFPCQYCSMKFKTKAHLNKHSLAVHPERHRRPGSSSGPKPKGK